MDNTSEEVAIYYILLFAIIVVNLIEIKILIKRRKKLSNYEWLLLSLSITDLLVGCIKCLVNTLVLVSRDTVLKTLPMLWFSVACSISHTVAITLDRLLAIAYPFKHRAMSTRSNICLMMGFSWAFGLIICPIAYTGRNVGQYVLAVATIATSIILLISYSFIIYKSILKRRRMNAKLNILSHQQSMNMRRELFLVCTCFIIVVTFISLMLPYSYSTLTGKRQAFLEKRALISNSLTNPLVYFFWKYMDTKIKKKKVTSSKVNQTSSKDKKNSQMSSVLKIRIIGGALLVDTASNEQSANESGK